MGPGQRSGYGDLLRAGRFGVQSPVEAIFYAPFHTGREVHAATDMMGSGALSRG